MTNDDMELVRHYVANASESAFAALVSRHTNLVYSAALRRVGSPQLAEEITQAVFIILAQKAASLGSETILSGWLYRATGYVSGRAFKQELRRRQREQEAYMQSLSDQTESEVWPQIMPLLEEAMLRLRQKDRDALVLRFFEGRSLKEVGAILGLSEAAAKMRLNRALEKLCAYFSKHGVTSTTATIAGAISVNSVQAVPVMLAKTATAAALAKGATASTSTSALIKGALKIMAWTKAKTAVAVCAGVLLAGGTATVIVKEVEQRVVHNDSEWDTGSPNPRLLETGPQIVRIIPSKYPNRSDRRSDIGGGRRVGLSASAAQLVLAAYSEINTRTIFATALPSEKFDFISNLPLDSQRALQNEVDRKFGVVCRRMTVETNVLFLRVKTMNADGLRPGINEDKASFHKSSFQVGKGEWRLANARAGDIARAFEGQLGIPVIDQSGLKGRYDADLKWEDRNDPDHEKLRQAVQSQLGIDLVPGTAPVDMLVVENAK